MPISIEKDLTGPIYFFMVLPGFSMISFPYSGSFDLDQLKDGVYNDEPSSSMKKHCKLSLYNTHIDDIYNLDLNNLNPDLAAFPCGLIPRFFPEDKFLFL